MFHGNNGGLLFHKKPTQTFTFDLGLCLQLVTEDSLKTLHFLTRECQETGHGPGS